MTAEASVRLRRLLAVLPLFADRGEVSLTEVARRTGIDAGELLDDLSALTEREDVPGGFIESIGIELGAERVAIRATHFLRPMRVTVPELCALELGVAMLRTTSTPDEWSAIDRARARIRKLIVKLPLDAAPLPWHSTPPAGSDSPLLASLRQAIAIHRKVRIGYRGSDDRETTMRTIAPLGALPSHGTWYIVGEADGAPGVRFYRLDRVSTVEMLAESFEVPPDFALDRVLAEGRPFRSSTTATMRVRYSPHIARWIAERESQPLDDDGSITITHQVADREWAVRHVLQYGPDAEVLEPASLRAEIAQRLTAMLA
ncbi:MAG: WYL domain-containing protein [Gemmatimonadota bacterium]|nr:WYL domain-containing protein [Gemmatimonadota bacterium]